MKVKALISFAGNKICMYQGQESVIEPALAFEYIKCGFLVEIKEQKKHESKRAKDS